jgi:hypothetical protein
MINYPTSLDTLTNPTATDPQNNPSHSEQHANANDAIEALQAKVGVNGSAVTTSHEYKISSIESAYQIVPSVSSNNLTVAFKTLAGNDPSASDPVRIRIGNTIHSITSALSVTINAGTNWCNAGSAELSNKLELILCIFGYNATDGVTLGFSRIPYGALYSDFSATTTNEKYCAISTITNATASDNYANIGYFAATLSAGAGYTWTVPTFTATNLVNRPIYETRKLSRTPGNLNGTGIPTSTTNTGGYQIVGNRIRIWGKWVGTASGSNFTQATTSSNPFTSVGEYVEPFAGGWSYTDGTTFDDHVVAYQNINSSVSTPGHVPVATRRPTIMIMFVEYFI